MYAREGEWKKYVLVFRSLSDANMGSKNVQFKEEIVMSAQKWEWKNIRPAGFEPAA